MGLNEFKDRLFDIINDTDRLPVDDIEVDDTKNQMKVCLIDGSQFMVRFESYGSRFLYDGNL